MNSKGVIALLTEMPQHVLRGSWRDAGRRWTVETHWPSSYEAVSLAAKRRLIRPESGTRWRWRWIAPCVAVIPESEIPGFKFPARFSRVVMLPDELQARCHAFNAQELHPSYDRHPLADAAIRDQETRERVDQTVKETEKLVSDYMEGVHPGLTTVVRTDPGVRSVEVRGSVAKMVKDLANFRYSYKPQADELLAFSQAARPGDEMVKVRNPYTGGMAIYVLVGPDEQAAFDRVVRGDRFSFLMRRL